MSRKSEKADVLATVPLFEGLGKKDLTQIALHVDETTIPAGSHIVEQGKVTHEVAIIVDGRVGIHRDGRLVGELGPGDTIGVMSSIDGQPQNATCIAEDDCRALIMTPKDLSELFERVPALARRVMVTLSRRLRESDARLDALLADQSGSPVQ